MLTIDNASFDAIDVLLDTCLAKYELVTLHQALKTHSVKCFMFEKCLYGYHSKHTKASIINFNEMTGKVQLHFVGNDKVSSETKYVNTSSVFVRVYNNDHAL